MKKSRQQKRLTEHSKQQHSSHRPLNLMHRPLNLSPNLPSHRLHSLMLSNRQHSQ